ncbi:hypothetical protein IAT38_008098 [Cryptococcus sp. DSM 104549]
MASPPPSAQESHPPPPAPLSDSSTLPPSSSDTSDGASPSSHIFSQINSSSPHLPALSTATAAALAAKYGPAVPYMESSAAASAATAEASSSAAPAVPPLFEKCMSFCSQSDGGRPMCRMFCVRKRTGLKRTRPARAHRAAAADPSSSSSSTDSTPAPERPIPSLSGLFSNLPPLTSILRMPFDAVRDFALPYSFVYVRGTPDGVVGRYMEELEWDDGVYDFEDISRGMSAKGAGRKQEETMIKKLDWGENGYLLHLPAASILSPISTFPEKAARATAPAMRLLDAYISSFTSGHQGRVLDKVIETAQNGGAFKLVGQMYSHWEGKLEAVKTQSVEQARALERRQDEGKVVGKDARKDVRKEGEESQ